MEINLLKKFKSLSPFVSVELPDFTIITGKNGSGKSQLFNLLETELNKTILIEPPVPVVKVGGIINVNSDIINREKWLAPIREVVSMFNTIKAKDLVDYVIENRIDPFPDDPFSINTNFNLGDAIRSAFGPNLTSHGFHGTTKNSEMIGTLIPRSSRKMFEMALEICKSKKKIFSELNEADFYNHTIEDSLVDSTDLFDSKIEMVFYNYAKRREKNDLDFFKKSQGKDNNSISPVEFLSSNRPPWEIINEILIRHRIDFHFNAYGEEDFNPDANFKLKIVNNSTKTELDFDELSSGEQIIIGLILKMFTSEHYQENLKFPDLIILDEPDAHLHPEMCKLLIEVLHETFVKFFKIKVLISTHSATTVALSPPENIFKLTNGPNTSLEKISKDDALKLLTSFIPTLTIDYENHKQIFVESPTDVAYYQTLYSKYLGDVRIENTLYHKLYFISLVAGKGNCDQVYAIVKELRGYGNTTAYGVVDWDKKEPTKTQDFVEIHGLKERYSVENYILDPLYIIVLLMNKYNDAKLKEVFQIDNMDNYYLLGRLSADRLDNLYERFFKLIEKDLPYYKYKDCQDVRYYNGAVLKFPKWYLEEQGHKIVGILKKTFSGLDIEAWRKEGNLQKDLVKVAAELYPFVPESTIQMFDKLGVKKL